MINLTAIVLTRENKIDKKISDTLGFADELIVWSSKVHNFGDNYATHRNNALSKASGEWVLFVDDDEYVSRSLREEILNSIKSNKVEGFLIRRQDLIFHQVVKHGEIGNIKILRLAKKGSGKFRRAVHEFWDIKGRVVELKNPLYHLKDTFVSSFISKMSEYAKIDIVELKNELKHFSLLRVFVNPLGKFVVNYFVRLGLLDGYVGLFSAYLMSVQSLTVRIFQWENQKY